MRILFDHDVPRPLRRHLNDLQSTLQGQIGHQLSSSTQAKSEAKIE